MTEMNKNRKYFSHELAFKWFMWCTITRAHTHRILDILLAIKNLFRFMINILTNKTMENSVFIFRNIEIYKILLILYFIKSWNVKFKKLYKGLKIKSIKQNKHI